jgi:hypothetical protein
LLQSIVLLVSTPLDLTECFFLYNMRIPAILLLLLLASCQSSSNKDKEGTEKPIARVLEKNLYPSDLKLIMPKKLNKKDSTRFADSYIQQWIMDELLLHQAEGNLSEGNKDIQKEIDEYRKNLLVYRYETELVKQKLDTLVGMDEINQYYESHKQNFMLKDNIVKVHYVKIDKKTPNADKVKKWYASSDEKEQDNLKKFCIQFASNFFIDDNTWLLLDDVMKEIPLRDYNPELFLKTTRNIELNDSLYSYYLFIKDFKIKNSPSPVSFEKDNIRQIIINKRKLNLIEEMKQSVYGSAKEKNNFEVYK